MKTITRLLVLMLVLAAIPVFAGEQFLLDGEGKIFVGEKLKRLPSPEEQKAYNSPGKKIFLWSPVVIQKESFFRGSEVRKASEYLIFDRDKGKIDRIKEDATTKGKEQFLWYVPMVLIAIICMTIGQIFFRRQRDKVDCFALIAFVIYSFAVVYSGSRDLVTDKMLLASLMTGNMIAAAIFVANESRGKTRLAASLVFCAISAALLWV